MTKLIIPIEFIINTISEKQTQKRQFFVILVIVFFGFLGISMPYLIFPSLFFNPEFLVVPAAWTDASRAIFLGITLAAYPLGQFLGSPILGSLSDDYGRKPLLIGSLMVAGFSNLLSGYSIASDHLTILILSRFLAGLMEGNIAIARAMASDLKFLSKHETFGKINAVASIAFLIGPFIGGIMTDRFLFEKFTTSTPFYMVFFLFMFLTALASVILKNRSPLITKEVKNFWKRVNPIERLSLLFKNKQLQFLMIVSTFFTLAVDIFYEFGPVYLTLKWSLKPADLILYNGGLCLGLAIGNGWLPSLMSKWTSNERALMISSILGFSFLLIGMIQTNSTLIMLLLVTMVGLFIGVGVTLITVRISNSVSDSIQGEVMGVQLSLRVLGDGIICLLGGAFLVLSPKAILLFAAFLAVGTAFYYGKRKAP